jgi:hypothetical protein
MPRTISPARRANQITFMLKGYLKNVQVSYIRAASDPARWGASSRTRRRLDCRSASPAVHPMRYEKAPEKAEAVAAAMRQKYWSDILGEPLRKLGIISQTVILRLLVDNGR